MLPDDANSQAAHELLCLAMVRFGDLSEAESIMLRAASDGRGAICLLNRSTKNAEDKIENAWRPEQHIRSDLLRWLCINDAAGRLIDPRGIQILGAKFSGVLDLTDTRLCFPLSLCGCWFTEDILLISAHIPGLILSRSSVRSVVADRLTVGGSVFMRDGFAARAGVRLPGAEISGDLDCSGGTFNGTSEESSLGS